MSERVHHRPAGRGILDRVRALCFLPPDSLFRVITFRPLCLLPPDSWFRVFPIPLPVVVIAVRICATINVPPARSCIRAAIAAVCRAAAEVPKNGSNPGVAMETPSAPARSGFGRTVPPVEEKSPGVIGVPFASKKNRRGPSELNVSTSSPPAKTPPTPIAPATSSAATAKALAAAACHAICPVVPLASWPLFVLSYRNRSAPENRQTTSRLFRSSKGE